MSMMRDRAGRAPVAARQVQAVGRHERRPHLAEALQAQRVRPTRAARSRRATPVGWAGWAGGARRFTKQAWAWWTEGTGRVAAVDADPAAPRPRHLAAQQEHRGEDLAAGWSSVLLVLGLYLEGWGHPGRAFPTPWHGLLVAALAGTAAWILAQGRTVAQARRRAWSLAAVPAGHRPALVGIGLAGLAVAGDAVWHLRYGEAQGPARLVAPFHLLLLAGACLLGSSTLRAAWSGPSSARVPGLAAFWPVLASTTLLVAATAWFLQPASPLANPAAPPQVGGLVGLLAQNLLFVAPVLLLLLRWQTPLGTFTVMAGSVSLLLATQTGPGLVGLAGAAVLGGAAADVAVTLLRPSPHRRWAARAVGAIAPAVYWTAHFVLLGAGYGAGWAPPAVAAAVLWASLSGLALAVCMWPPAVPLTAWNRGRSPARQATRSTTRSPATPAPMPAPMVGR
jgi:hypothetical protein